MSLIKNIYCISGLGADYRIFENLSIPAGFTLKHIPWISPDHEETIDSYAQRMASKIQDPEPILIGVSFGGMLSVEIAKILPVKKIVLISSIKSSSEKPLYFRIARSLRLNRIVGLKPYKFLEPIENFTLGARTEEEKILAREYREQLDLPFSNWAIDRILRWENDRFPADVVHIQGSDDHVFPLRYIKPTHVIAGGGHLMIMDKSAEISGILTDVLAVGR